jgi:hypothetical protein
MIATSALHQERRILVPFRAEEEGNVHALLHDVGENAAANNEPRVSLNFAHVPGHANSKISQN